MTEYCERLKVHGTVRYDDLWQSTEVEELDLLSPLEKVEDISISVTLILLYKRQIQSQDSFEPCRSTTAYLGCLIQFYHFRFIQAAPY
jgi:hypothetical protein